MINELCKELKNWFDYNRIYGAFEIVDGKIVDADFLNEIHPNQYFRIIGSVFNDGVYKYQDTLTLIDEIFVGSVWFMAVPKEVIRLAGEIDAWNDKYADAVSSPYSSESFGGYSYTKSSEASNATSWKQAFASRLNNWRKL